MSVSLKKECPEEASVMCRSGSPIEGSLDPQMTLGVAKGDDNKADKGSRVSPELVEH